jgi:hypothetical protein
MLFFNYFGAIWTSPYGPKKVPKGQEVGGMYDPIFKLKNKPLTKLFVCRIKRHGGEHFQKTYFPTFFFAIFGLK